MGQDGAGLSLLTFSWGPKPEKPMARLPPGLLLALMVKRNQFLPETPERTAWLWASACTSTHWGLEAGARGLTPPPTGLPTWGCGRHHSLHLELLSLQSGPLETIQSQTPAQGASLSWTFSPRILHHLGWPAPLLPKDVGT